MVFSSSTNNGRDKNKDDSVGHRREAQVLREERPVENVVTEYLNPQTSRIKWVLIYGVCAGATTGSQKFTPKEEALAALAEFGPAKMIDEQGNA